MERVNELLSSYKYPLLIALVGSVLIFSGSFSALLQTPVAETKELPTGSLTDSPIGLIKVDIAGAVNKPGVYELQKEQRVDDLLTESGGFHPDANPEFIAKNLNLSQKLTDGEKIYIPFKGESGSSGVVVNGLSSVKPQIKTKLSLNNATQSELEELPGIGPSTSSKIIANRPYQSINELLTKKVVGKATFEKIKDLVEL